MFSASSDYLWSERDSALLSSGAPAATSTTKTMATATKTMATATCPFATAYAPSPPSREQSHYNFGATPAAHFSAPPLAPNQYQVRARASADALESPIRLPVYTMTNIGEQADIKGWIDLVKHLREQVIQARADLDELKHMCSSLDARIGDKKDWQTSLRVNAIAPQGKPAHRR